MSVLMATCVIGFTSGAIGVVLNAAFKNWPACGFALAFTLAELSYFLHTWGHVK